ncbi:PTRHD1 [Branchiostoma lanceolatum]|uniref:peptidyl-tRNA hydrolase n=1 Tax=Branchiostoma lanceolatum TaxID=7740 RepID=A0A8K0EGB2_BRALA|nr:PTRHD1 [Branchiostoma lanceolatum]
MAVPLVQYVVVRADLLRALKWPTGAVMAQACHACTAVLHVYRDDTNTREYLSSLDSMHKVVLEGRHQHSGISVQFRQYAQGGPGGRFIGGGGSVRGEGGSKACHACTAVLHVYRDDTNTREYLSSLDSMHKVVLEVRGEGGSVRGEGGSKACHACTAVLHVYRDDTNTREYLSSLDSMHKVVLEAKDEESLCMLAEQLQQSNVDHKLWVEQPENTATCLAVKPYPKSEVQKHFKNFKLFK